MSLPATMKALVLNEDYSMALVTDKPVPSPTHGAATIRVLATIANANLVRMTRQDNSQGFTQPRPLVPGANAIGRVVAVGPDATALRPGQLVAVDMFVRGRDDPNVQILWGMHDGLTPATKRLHADAWRDSTYAEYVRAPFENTYALDEKVLCGSVEDGGFGYSINDLAHIIPHGVPYGGLRSINLQAGETLVISPATGMFSGAAIATALGMGGTVIAASRSSSGLEKLTKTYPSIRTVTLSGDVQADTAAIIAANAGRSVEAFLDFSPPAATRSTYVTSCMLAVKPYGRICLMGNRGDDSIPIPWSALLYNNLTIKGGFMYERQDIWALVRLFESGRLKLGEENGFHISGAYKLEDWDECADVAVKNEGFGQITVLTP